MHKEIEHLRVWPVYLPATIKSQAAAAKEAETYCATPARAHMNSTHGYFKECTWLQFGAGLTSMVSIFPILIGVSSNFPSLVACSATVDIGFWLLTVAHWKNRKQKLLAQYGSAWQKQHEIATNKLTLAAKNLVAICDFFKKQVNHFNKYQRYLETGVVSLDETQLIERQKLCEKLNGIGDNLNKRVNQLDYLLDRDTKPSLEQDVIGLIDLLSQADIGNEIAKLLDPRFKTLSEAEMETKALALLEELPQHI